MPRHAQILTEFTNWRDKLELHAVQEALATPETVTVVQVVQPVGQEVQLLPLNLYPKAHLLQDGVDDR